MSEKTSAPSSPPSPEIVEQILQAIQKVRHGTVQIIIQDGRVVQIDTTEKIRIVSAPS